MQNVFIQRANNNLYTILSDTVEDVILRDSKDTAIFIYLYYLSSINDYMGYINGIPNSIDTYIISAKKEVLDEANERINKRSNLFYLQKPNIGRDVSALLVTARQHLLNYQYICFVHDKKSKYISKTSQTQSWINNLWNNTLGSRTYINNLVYYLKTHETIGLLTPIEDTTFFCKNFWADDYELTLSLAKKLDVVATDISQKYQPITLGTCFWARTSALYKLFLYDWKYSDFMPEPMPNDGTISHAVERILPYVVQDAGYLTATVMSENFLKNQFAILHTEWLVMSTFIRKEYGISDAKHLCDYQNGRIKEDLLDYCSKYNKVYIYGAGIKALDAKHFLEKHMIRIDGFLVTDLSNQMIRMQERIPIFQVDQIELSDAGIVIGVNRDYWEEIEIKLKEIEYTSAFFLEI